MSFSHSASIVVFDSDCALLRRALESLAADALTQGLAWMRDTPACGKSCAHVRLFATGAVRFINKRGWMMV